MNPNDYINQTPDDDADIEWAYRYEETWYAPYDPWDEWGDNLGPPTLKIELRKYPIMRRTAKGIWIAHWNGPKFVNLEKHKKFASPNLKDAQESFLARKQRQAEILQRQLTRTEKTIARAKTEFGLVPNDELEDI